MKNTLPLLSSLGFSKGILTLLFSPMKFILGLEGLTGTRDSERKLPFHGLSNKLNLIQTLFNKHLFDTNKLTGISSVSN